MLQALRINIPACSRHVCTSGRVAKGHSHWQNIAQTKGKNDMERSAVISRYMYGLTKLLVKSNFNTNMATNVELARYVDEIIKAQVPKATVDAALERAKNRSQNEVEQFFFSGPGQSKIVIEVSCDKRISAENGIKRVINKIGGFVETSNKNTLNFFQHKGIIHVPVSAAPGETTKLLSVAQAEDLAIELGAEEVTTTVDENNVDVIEFVCEPDDMHRIAQDIERREYNVSKSELVFKPWLFVTLPPPSRELVEKFYEKIQDPLTAVKSNFTIERIFDNIEWPDEE